MSRVVPLTLTLSPNARNVLGEREDTVETLTQGCARGSGLELALAYDPLYAEEAARGGLRTLWLTARPRKARVQSFTFLPTGIVASQRLSIQAHSCLARCAGFGLGLRVMRCVTIAARALGQ